MQVQQVDVAGYRARVHDQARRLERLAQITGDRTDGRASGALLALSYLDEFIKEDNTTPV
jgi:hypothetical protein